MFERYTEKARRVIFFARYEANQFGSETIEPEHILLGLFREDKGFLPQLLPRRISTNEVRKDIEGRVLVPERVSTSVILALSDATKSALEFAAEESERLHHRYIGTEHLLLGLLRADRTVAAEILYEYGLRLDTARIQLEQPVRRDVDDIEMPESGMFEGLYRDHKLSELIQALENHQVLKREDVQPELIRLFEHYRVVKFQSGLKESLELAVRLPFQALLNVLRKNGTITEEEFNSLSTDDEHPKAE